MITKRTQFDCDTCGAPVIAICDERSTPSRRYSHGEYVNGRAVFHTLLPFDYTPVTTASVRAAQRRVAAECMIDHVDRLDVIISEAARQATYADIRRGYSLK